MKPFKLVQSLEFIVHRLKRQGVHILFLSLFLLLSTMNYQLSTAFAAIPHTINYQGKLTDKAGKPVSDGSYNVTFKLYDNSAGSSNASTNTPWVETQSVTVQKGIFNVLIGGVTSGGISLPFDRQYWLGIQVGSDTEMRPLQQLASSAYALRAENADNATKVNNIEASTTPQANKLLPLDANAKLPASTLGLKVYDSGWFEIGASTNITKDHNLGTEKVVVQCIAATSANGSGTHYLVQPYDDIRPACDRDGLRLTITSTQIKVFTASVGLMVRDDGGGGEYYMRSLRIIMLALE